MISPLPSQSFRHRLLALVLGEAVKKICIAAAFVWLARIVDQSVYGSVEWALSVMYIFGLAADAGLTTWAAGQVAARPETAAAIAGGVVRLRLAMAIPSFVALLMVAALYGAGMRAAIVVYGTGLFLTPFYMEYLFNGLHQTRWTGIGSAVRGVVFAIIVIQFARADSTPMVGAVAELAGAAAMVCVHVLALHKVFRLPIHFDNPAYGITSLLRRSWTVCASELTWGSHWYAGLILTGVLAKPDEVAWQSASLRLILALHTGVWLYLTVLLPTFARLIRSDTGGWRRLTERSLRVSGWLSLGITLVGTLGGSFLVAVVFGPRFAPSAPIFRVMVWVIPIAWMSGHIRYSLIAAEHPQKDYLAAIVGAVTTTVLTLLLFPALGGIGAALALVGGTLSNAIVALWFGRSLLPAISLWGSFTASGSWCLVAIALGMMLGPFAGPWQSAIFACLLFAVAGVVSEWETVRSLLQMFSHVFPMKVSSNADART